MGMEMFCVMRVSVGLIRTHIWLEPSLWIFWWEHFSGGRVRFLRHRCSWRWGELGGLGKVP